MLDIDGKVKPLYATLLKMGIKKFLGTGEFRLCLIKADCDHLWSGLRYDTLGLNPYDSETTLGMLLTKLLKDDPPRLLLFLDEILMEFSQYSHASTDSSEIFDLLKKLNSPLNEIRSMRIFKPEAQMKKTRVLESAAKDVLFEYGLCVGALRRENMCPLVMKGSIEIPSDTLGYGYIQFENSVAECKEMIRKELEAAGYQIR